MTPQDRRAFAVAYNTLCVAYQHRLTPKEHAQEEIVYFESLKHLPIEALARAGELLRRNRMLTKGFVPKTPEWAAVAAPLAPRAQHGPSPVPLTLAETKRITKVRAGFLASLRARGEQAWVAVADRVEKMLRIPRALPPVACAACGDSGFAKHAWTEPVSGEPVEGVTPCACRQTNPVILARVAEARLALDQGSLGDEGEQKRLTDGG